MVAVVFASVLQDASGLMLSAFRAAQHEHVQDLRPYRVSVWPTASSYWLVQPPP